MQSNSCTRQNQERGTPHRLFYTTPYFSGVQPWNGWEWIPTPVRNSKSKLGYPLHVYNLEKLKKWKRKEHNTNPMKYDSTGCERGHQSDIDRQRTWNHNEPRARTARTTGMIGGLAIVEPRRSSRPHKEDLDSCVSGNQLAVIVGS